MDKMNVLHWLLTLSVCSALLGGALAYAQARQCSEAYACGSNVDGTTMMCTRWYVC
jgi:hypothetical protein